MRDMTARLMYSRPLALAQIVVCVTVLAVNAALVVFAHPSPAQAVLPVLAGIGGLFGGITRLRRINAARTAVRRE